MKVDIDTFNRFLAKATEAERYGEDGWRGQSTGERLAVALVLNRFDWLQKMEYSIPEALCRIDKDWLEVLPYVYRQLKKNNVIN